MNLTRWRASVFVLYASGGIVAGSIASRTPAIAHGLDIGIAQMGGLITGMPIGSIVAILASSHVIHLLGPRNTSRTALIFAGGGVALIGISASTPGSYAGAFVGFMIYGFAVSMSNIVMNVQAAEIDRRSARTLMPLFHGTFSIGTFVGAGVGTIVTLLNVPVAFHFGAAGLAFVLAAVFAASNLQRTSTLQQAQGEQAVSTTFRDRMGVWLERRTLLIGVIALGAAFIEGTANNWLTLAMVEDRGLTAALGAAYLTVFTASMTVGRLSGGYLVDRFGRVAIIRFTLVLAALGVLVVVFLPAAAIVGIVFWGLGASLGYPLAISASADDPRNAAARVSAVAAVGSVAMLLGPSVIGVLGEHTTLLTAFLVVVVLIGFSFAASGAAHPPAGLKESPLETEATGADVASL